MWIYPFPKWDLYTVCLTTDGFITNLGIINSGSLWDQPPSKSGSKSDVSQSVGHKTDTETDPETDAESTTSKSSKGVFYCVTASPPASPVPNKGTVNVDMLPLDGCSSCLFFVSHTVSIRLEKMNSIQGLFKTNINLMVWLNQSIDWLIDVFEFHPNVC